jgi:ADP-ribosylglycohydrolase
VAETTWAEAGVQAGRYVGCLLGGAAGDALGAAVEFSSWPDLVRRFGPGGIRDYAYGHFSAGQITDDTQMTMATAEGLIAAASEVRSRDVAAVVASVYERYLGWYRTQNNPGQRRGPGNTCLSALGSGAAGSVTRPINNSKGCGGVMRVAPVGLALPGRPDEAFELGVATAALTHGHPGGYFPAGIMAAITSRILAGENIAAAAAAEIDCRGILVDRDTLGLLQSAVRLAARGADAAGAWRELGEGWTGDEALAIALFGALRHPESLEEAIVLTVNHSGDSDSTGSICGALLGCALGAGAVPARWLHGLEHRDTLERMGLEMARLFGADGGT